MRTLSVSHKVSNDSLGRVRTRLEGVVCVQVPPPPPLADKRAVAGFCAAISAAFAERFCRHCFPLKEYNVGYSILSF